MKIIISEVDITEVTYNLIGESKPSDSFEDACRNPFDRIKIWKMLPGSFLEANGFIVPK